MTILFVSVAALNMATMGIPPSQRLVRFVIHLVPSFLLLLFLVVAWQQEIIGGVLFTILGLGFIPFNYIMNYHMNHSVWISLGRILMFNVPFILVGVLFFFSYFLRNKNTSVR